MNNLFICLVCGIMIVAITGCEEKKEYYCNDGDTLIGNTCLHKTNKQAMTCGCSSLLGCRVCADTICTYGTSGLCPGTTHYECGKNDGELYGDRCIKEETYPAHIKE